MVSNGARIRALCTREDILVPRRSGREQGTGEIVRLAVCPYAGKTCQYSLEQRRSRAWQAHDENVPGGLDPGAWRLEIIRRIGLDGALDLLRRAGPAGLQQRR